MNYGGRGLCTVIKSFQHLIDRADIIKLCKSFFASLKHQRATIYIYNDKIIVFIFAIREK